MDSLDPPVAQCLETHAERIDEHEPADKSFAETDDYILPPRFIQALEAKLLGQSPCRDPHSVSCSNGMTDAQEKRLIEALRKVDAHGDAAPANVQDPMTMVLRQRAI